jgi:hypothetical protein
VKSPLLITFGKPPQHQIKDTIVGKPCRHEVVHIREEELKTRLASFRLLKVY